MLGFVFFVRSLRIPASLRICFWKRRHLRLILSFGALSHSSIGVKGPRKLSSTRSLGNNQRPLPRKRWVNRNSPVRTTNRRIPRIKKHVSTSINVPNFNKDDKSNLVISDANSINRKSFTVAVSSSRQIGGNRSTHFPFVEEYRDV